MFSKNFFLPFLWTLSFLAVTVGVSHPTHAAATIPVVNLDGPGEGFNDPTPFTPVGGNPATTRGQARLIAFQHAANLWAGQLTSGVEIRVGANFDPLGGSPGSAILGAAGPETVHRDFPGAPVASTWYPQALANSLAGIDLDPASNDLGAVFNSDVDGDVVLGTTHWYYGLDGNPPGADIDFVTVVLHELTHGLGFLTLVDLAAGAKFLGFNDVYMLDLEHHGAIPPDFPSMTNAQRFTAMRSAPNLHWVGPNVVAAKGNHVEMYAPNPAQPGSSVSHFSTSLFPNELMEPFFTGVNHNVGLAAPLFSDIGWSAGAAIGSVKVSPGTSTLAATQKFDVAIVIQTTQTITGGSVLFDGINVTPALLSGIFGTIPAGGITIRLPNVGAGGLGVGTHTLSVGVNTTGGMLTDAATWEVIQNTEP